MVKESWLGKKGLNNQDGSKTKGLKPDVRKMGLKNYDGSKNEVKESQHEQIMG